MKVLHYITHNKHVKKSGNWGLNEIDCHCSHKGQCTSRKHSSLHNKNIWKKIFRNLKIKIQKKYFKKKLQEF